jgi:hypothetical protein
MKRLTWVLVLLLTAAPAWAANKSISVQQLKDLLGSLQQQKKTDAQVDDQLKEIELNEELTGSVANSLISYLPGPLSIVRIEILKEQSAYLAPPAADLPATPSPDEVAQKAILDKATNFASKVYMQNPHLSATKTTIRFEDRVITTNSVGLRNFNMLLTPIKMIGTQVDEVETDKGAEAAAASRAKTKWGLNGEISEGEPGTNLGAIFLEASSSGKIRWLRWQMIDGRKTAVFSFVVEQNNSRFDVNYCCFPKTEIEDKITLSLRAGSIQSVSTWKTFNKVVGYHGEFFIIPNTGIVVRVITHAEMKPTDFVTREDRRIDYGPVVIAGKAYLLPLVSLTALETVPNADDSTQTHTIRHTLFDVSYQNYKLAGAR